MVDFQLERMQFVATQMLQDENIKALSNATLESHYSFTARGLIIAMKLFIWGRQRDRRIIKWPVDWWEALKLRFAPFWFTRRWPVRWHTVIITKHDLYPGLTLQGVKAVPFSDVAEYEDGYEDE